MIQAFETRKEAVATQRTLVGWKSRIVKLSFNADDIVGGWKHYWVIRCNGTKHLHTDGFVG